MLTTLEIHNFKSLKSFKSALGSLTLLTGLNAAGKSSVVQSLALLKQTATDHEWSKTIRLNGSSVQLGTMVDVINRDCGGSGFKIALSTRDWRLEWDTTSDDRKRELVAKLFQITLSRDNFSQVWNADDLSTMAIRCLVPELIQQTAPHIFKEIQFILSSICYIGAERIGPREVYVAHSPLIYADVGTQGEKTPWCLEQFADSPVNAGLQLPGVPNLTRLTVESWMMRLFPGFKLEIKRIDAANLVTMGIRTSPRGDFFRPSNVGFGITHVLPIITACVAAEKGRLLVIENPETHLHPAGQSLVGYFIALAATSGVQVVVETHSDHVLNGIRRAVRDHKIQADDVKIYFFHAETEDNGETSSHVDPVVIDSKGRLTEWPTGFFDQMEADLDYLYTDTV